MPADTWTLQPYPTADASAALIIPVPVAGGLGLDPLDAADTEAVVHERVGGYWEVGIAQGQRLSIVQTALKSGRRVLIVGFHQTKVVRILEVSTSSPYPPPPSYNHVDKVCRSMLKQPDTAFLGPGRTQPFAVTYARRISGAQEFRARFFTQPTADGSWVGRRIEAEVGQMSYQSPALYSSSDVPQRST